MHMRATSLFLSLLSVLATGCGPLWWFPGGELRGNESSMPARDWAELDHCKIIQLETRSPEPYSINIWAAGLGDQLYLASGGGDGSRWVRKIAAEPTVRVKACDQIYSMRATHTLDEAELERFLTAVERKYDWQREQALEYRSWVFRLDPLTAAAPSPANANSPKPCVDPRPEICAQVFAPVCAERDNGVRCVTTPCDSSDPREYPNACEACRDPLVFAYSAGPC